MKRTRLAQMLLIGASAFVQIAVAAPVPPSITLTGTIRDFKLSGTVGGHIDFENWCCGSDTGIVLSTLGGDGNPVYAGTLGNPSTHGATAFNQWFNDTQGVNLSMPYAIQLNWTGSAYNYTNNNFFPIDDLLFGNQGKTHNYGFTYELNTRFAYVPGQTFTFTGDDDVFVFIDKKLAIDLGGVHPSATGTVNLDTLGLTAGQTYDMNIFFAERHTTQSTFQIQTNIAMVPEAESWALMLAGLGLLGYIVRRRPV